MRCMRIAESQVGLIHRLQAMGAGLSRSAIDRRVRAGRWEHALPSVYRMRGCASSLQQRAMAACL
ncbi:MAG: type IV toxin-antitoxin system AbiEi family antitoxin domain-containing protein [Actinomycetota bacterium]